MQHRQVLRDLLLESEWQGLTESCRIANRKVDRRKEHFVGGDQNNEPSLTDQVRQHFQRTASGGPGHHAGIVNDNPFGLVRIGQPDYENFSHVYSVPKLRSRVLTAPDPSRSSRLYMVSSVLPILTRTASLK